MKLHDFYGLTPKITDFSGLMALLAVLNINHPVKGELKNKAAMEKELEENPILFLDYAVFDVITLSQCERKLIDKSNHFMKNLLKLPEKLMFSRNPFHSLRKATPTTVGSYVCQLLEKFLTYSLCYEGYSLEEGEKRERLMNEVKKSCSLTLKNVLRMSKGGSEVVSDFFSGASIKSFVFLYSSNTGLWNAMVQGGRASNERPSGYLLENVADVDMSGCYSTALNDFEFPLGLPSVKAFTKDDIFLTLKEFLDLYEHEFVPNLYQIIVRGNLSFPQTLIYSKILNETSFFKKTREILDQTSNQDEDVDNLQTGDFHILTHEIVNGMITSDLLDMLRQICTSQELKEIYDLEVVTAVFYKKSDRREKQTILNEWKSSSGSYTFDIKTQTNKDSRSRLWTSIPLKSFLGPLIQERKKLKQAMSLEKNPVEKEILNMNQTFLKLIMNTVYGVLCSQYFDIGNVVLGNNITCRARAQVWMISRALNATNSITDGCLFGLNEVFSIRVQKSKKKPGLASLSFLKNLENHRMIIKGPLGGEEKWDVEQKRGPLGGGEKEGPYDRIDELVQEHIQTFFSHYNLKLHYSLERKPEHTTSKLFYMKQAHYALFNTQNNLVFKFRGLEKVEDPSKMSYAQKLALSVLLGYTLPKDESMIHTSSELQGIYNYLQSVKKNGPEKSVVPGYSIEKSHEFRSRMKELPCVNTQMWSFMKKEEKDYANELRKGLSFEETFTKRWTDYEKIYAKYLKKHLEKIISKEVFTGTETFR